MTQSFRWCLFDAARDYATVALARRWNTPRRNLWDGPRGEQLEDVAPHLFACDPRGNLAKLALRPAPPGEVGVLIDAPESLGINALRKHLRRFLSVRRERDGRRVYFRYYDPRVLRVFLPVCTAAELGDFFGPIEAFHCQAERVGSVLTYQRDVRGRLAVAERPLREWLEHHYPGRPTGAVVPSQPAAR